MVQTAQPDVSVGRLHETRQVPAGRFLSYYGKIRGRVRPGPNPLQP